MLSIINQRNFLAIVTLVASSSVLSKDISYDFIEGGYASTNIDVSGIELDSEGFAIGGSSSTTKNMALTSSIGTTTLEFPQGEGLDLISVSVGLTAHTLITSNTSLFGNFSLLYGKVEHGDSDTGNATTIGLRHMATDSFEFDVAATHTRLFDDIENSLAGGVRFYVDEKFSLGIGYAIIDNSDIESESILLSARIDM